MRNAVAQLALAAVAIACVVTAAEVALRIREIPESALLEDQLRLRHMDDGLHHALAPGVTARSRWGGAIVTYTTNDLGFRDRAVRVVEPDPGSRQRVLVLGDSFAEAMGVEYEDAFPHGIEQRLNAAGLAAEVLNGGTASYAPRFEYRQLIRFLERGYAADAVVLLLDVSDVHDEGKQYADWNGHTNEARAARGLEQRREIDEHRQREAAWSDRLRSRLLERFFPDADPLPPRYTRVPRFQWTEQPEIRTQPWVDLGIAVCSEYLDRIRELSETLSMPFTLVLYPHPSQLSGVHCADSEYRRVFTEFARERSIATVDLFPTFCEMEDWTDHFIRGDVHWNARGHALVADALAEHLLRVLR